MLLFSNKSTNHLVQFSAQFVIFILDLNAQTKGWLVFICMTNFALKNLLNIMFFFKYNNQFRNTLLLCGRVPPVIENERQTNSLRVR